MTIEYITATVQLDRLTPFSANSELFSDSLTPASIEGLANDIELHGLSQPILTADVPCDDGIGFDLTVVDGHRRERAFRLLRGRHPRDTRWQSIPHRHLGHMTRDQVLWRILDCFSAARQATPRELAALYTAMVQRLQREHGIIRGRASQNNLGGTAKIAPADLYAQAASRVGISSARLARDMVRVFRDAPPDVQDRVNRGEMAVSAAIECLRSSKSDVADNPFLDDDPSPSTKPSSRPVVKVSPPAAPHAVTEGESSPEGQLDVSNDGSHKTLTDIPKGRGLFDELVTAIDASGNSPSAVLSLLCARYRYVPPRRASRPSGKAAELAAKLAGSNLGEGVCAGLMIHLGHAEAIEDEEEDAVG